MFITETTHNNLGYIYLVSIVESTCLLIMYHCRRSKIMASRYKSVSIFTILAPDFLLSTENIFVYDLVNRYGLSVSQMTTDMFVCRNHNLVLSPFMTCHCNGFATRVT